MPESRKMTARLVEEPLTEVDTGMTSVGAAAGEGAMAREGATCESGSAMHGERGAGATREARWPKSGTAAGEAQWRRQLGLEQRRHDVRREKDGRGQEKRKRVGPHPLVRF